MMKKLLYIFVALIWFNNANAQTNLSIEVQNGSYTSIDGCAGVMKYKITQTAENFLKKKYNIVATKNQQRIYLDVNSVYIPVKAYTSTNKIALKDFLKMMEPEKYKNMVIELIYIEIPSDINKTHTGNAVFNFKIKGVSKKYAMPVKFSKEGDIYTLISSKQINIRDFGLEPPAAMMGLVKTSEFITVGLHFILKIAPI